jgi:CPA2 family monovalent cation:H+ antiporter-2
MSLAQIGEFSFIIAGLGLSLRATGDKLYSLAVLVSAVTTLTTPYLITWSNPVADWLEQKCPRWLMDIGRVYQTWLRSVQSNPRAPHPSARMFVRKLLGQLGMQLALITAPILGAAGFWEAYGNRLPEGFRMAWWGGPIIWLGGAILALPVVVAFLRKFHALGMLVSEIVFPHRKGDQGVDPARTWATLLFCGTGYTVLGIYLVLISSPLLPAGKILWVFLGILTLITFGSRKKLVELYSKGQFSIRQTWESLPDQEQVILPRNSEVRAYRIGEDSVFVGNTLQETGLRNESGVVVVAIERQSGNKVSPGPAEKLFANDEIFVFGEQEQLVRAEEYFNSRGVTAV